MPERPARRPAASSKIAGIGLFFPPTYLSVRFETDGHDQDLYQILQRRRRLDHADAVADSPHS